MMRKIIALGWIFMFVALFSGYLIACKRDPNQVAGIKGTVTASGAGLQGVVLTLISYSHFGHHQPTFVGTAMTDTSGNYYFEDIGSRDFTVTPSKSGYTFYPASSHVWTTDYIIDGIDFTATIASEGDYVGIWNGIYVEVKGGTTNAGTASLALSSNLTGSLVIQISGTNTRTHNLTTPTLVTNGTISFSLPLAVEDAADPNPVDCAGWSVSCSGALSNSSKLNITCSGLYCSAGGVQYGSANIDMTKQ
jgi:hypothetical protein